MLAGAMEIEKLQSLTVVQLKAKLSEMGLASTGKKAELIERLMEAEKLALSKEKIAATTQQIKPTVPNGSKIAPADDAKAAARAAKFGVAPESLKEKATTVTNPKEAPKEASVSESQAPIVDSELLQKLKQRRERFGFTSDLLVKAEAHAQAEELKANRAKKFKTENFE